MTALLDLPAIRERAARLSVEEYHRLGELPIELLRGTLIEKMSKSPAHQFYSDRLEVHRKPVREGYSDRTVVSAPAGLESTALPGIRVDLAALFA